MRRDGTYQLMDTRKLACSQTLVTQHFKTSASDLRPVSGTRSHISSLPLCSVEPILLGILCGEMSELSTTHIKHRYTTHAIALMSS